MEISVKKYLGIIPGSVSYESEFAAGNGDSDAYKLHFDFQDWLPPMLNGVETEGFTLEIRGNLELDGFFEAVDSIKEMHAAHKSLINKFRNFYGEEEKMNNPIPQCSPDSPEWAFRAAEMINDLQRRVHELEKDVAYLEYCQDEEHHNRNR